jgi:RHS repeat-associated protein
MDQGSQNSKESSSSQGTISSKSDFVTAPSISLPKGGGAIQGIGEKFAANPVTGTGSMSIPIAVSPGRSGFSPQLSLSYDSGASNGPFSLGWNLSLPSIIRKTDKGIPKYHDREETDVFLLSGVEDLVPVLIDKGGGNWERETIAPRKVDGKQYDIQRYRPRIEGLFARIERWTNQNDLTDTFWRSISKDNITTWYGKTVESRISDPSDPNHIFSWLICESYDDKGNVIAYQYAEENSDGIDLSQAHEQNRSLETRKANRYLKYVKYGNLNPYLPILTETNWTALPGDDEWMFEVVFDYGEHDPNNPRPNELTSKWPVRNDPFSSFRAGFEVRTYRLCQRVLMFHHFPEEENVGQNCLVRSTDFTYSYEKNPDNLQNSIFSFLLAVTQSGYKRKDGGGYLSKSLPPVEFEYSQPIIDETIREIDSESLENLPYGLDRLNYQWVDLDGEGLNGILTEQADGWFYKRNISANKQIIDPDTKSLRTVARFNPVELVATKPNSNLASGQAQFMDLAGDGSVDLVTMEAPIRGFYERTDDEDWEPFRSFESWPNVDTRDPNLRFIDLTGDGLADILISEDQAFVWHASLAEAGFEPARRVQQVFDEEKGPHIVFADITQSIYLADMSGDGLTDILRIRNGEVCYWPNLGYCRFGAKVTMDNSPWFDSQDIFDQRRVRLADIDGSGAIDIIYIGTKGIQIYFNQSGNGWSKSRLLTRYPHIDNLSAIETVDLLGNGTACLVWSSPLPGNAQRQMRYIDLMGGQKPYLMIKSVNNLGAETQVQYAPSTKFYLNDKQAGKPWITKLPFPVHVVERIEIRDFISHTRFSSNYSYHHGYFDGEEREFRGFAMVEQTDTEAFEDYVIGVKHIEGLQELDPELYQPPVTTRTWFHTGAFLGRDKILHQVRDEYYLQQQHIPEPVLPAGMDDQEYRECLRALKGLPLRSEVYSFDGSAQEQHPYSVVENNYDVKLVQRRGDQKHTVFFTYGCETVAHYYERNPADPRIAHSLNLEIGPYGNVLKSASIVYGRKIADPELPAQVTQNQQKLYITYGEADYTPDIDQETPASAYRLRVAYESRSYEITGISPNSGLFKLTEIRNKIAAATAIPYEAIANGVAAQKRLLSQSRSLFLDNSLNPLPLGQWDTLGLGHESYQLAFTPGVTGAYYTGKVTDVDFSDAGFIHFNSDANWWIPSGTAIYPANPVDHFYIPIGAKDPLGVETVATYDKYDLLIELIQVKQATWNVVTSTNDYRVLGSVMMTDPNKNLSVVEIDELGMVVKSAIMGKVGAGEGDTLANPTARMEYELFNWMNNQKPNFVHTSSREQHGAANPRWQESYAYSNGSGGVAIVKAQAHPGKALKANLDGSVTEVDADPRWVGNGRTLLNNKGNPVKQYEPYFSTTHEYEDEKALREIGVTPILYYDAAGRNIRTLFPNGTFVRVEFNPWMQKVFDANDTIKESQWYADRGSPDPASQPEPLNNPEQRAAWLAAKHADTPGTVHSDSLGRPIYAISDYGAGKSAAVRSESDLTGRFSKLFDQQQRQVADGFISMIGTPIYGESAEKGKRWTFMNVLGALVKTWDEHGREFRAKYDVIHRPVSTFVLESGKPEILFNYVVYGDRHPNAEQRNLLGVAHQIFDQAGMVRVPELDFKGNPKSVERILAKDYKNNLNWNTLDTQPNYATIQAAANPALEMGEVFTASAIIDALNRPTRVTLPDNTIIIPQYNEANFLASLQAQIRGQGAFIEFLKDQDYDAKGQRQFAHYGNEVFTRYFYDPKTFRLSNLLTYKSGSNPELAGLQNLKYTYDPVGNITHILDDAQQTHYFNNAVVKPESLYEYDAIYQLIRATGRELAGGANNAIRNHGDLEFVSLPHANDTNAVRTYTEEYEYDLLGNITALKHRYQAQVGVGSGWTRYYHYAYQDNPADLTNRLISTSQPGDPEGGPYTATYNYDAYGNMTKMPHLADMAWNFMDQLRQVDLGGGGTAHYVYGLNGQRLRKVIEHNGNQKLEWIFLGAVMIFRRRRRDTNALRLERWTVHISDNTGHIAQIDTKTRDDDGIDPANPLNAALIRYQYADHLGSVVLETDDGGNSISYEEYHPYGTSAYRSTKPGFDLSLKRYRFSGKERDDETGLYYFGARYYAAWLGKWTSSDPMGLVDGINLYAYTGNNPINFRDANGTQRCAYIIYQQGLVGQELVPGGCEAVRREGKEPPGVIGYIRLPRSPTPSAPASAPATTPRRRSRSSSVRPAPTPEPAPEPEPEPAPEAAPAPELAPAPSSSPSASPTESPASPGGTALSLTGPGAERFIWEYPFAGVRGAQRGRILEWMFGNTWRDTTPRYDIETPSSVQQIKSTDSFDEVGQIVRDATRDADAAITANPTGTMAGKRPQAVIVTPTDAPASVDADIANALGRGRRTFGNTPLPPEHVRGFPGGWGTAARGLGIGGTGLSAISLANDIRTGDAPMVVADTLGTAGGGLEIYALYSSGATVAGVSAMSAGLVLGGAGIAIGSGISAYRAYKRGDTPGVVAGIIGVAAGLAIVAGVIFGAPLLLAAGIIGAIGVGLFHLGRWLFGD